MDLIGGVPYTSDDFPWPKTTDGEYWMQPILQLNLQEAGARLGIDLGSDLLQVWGPVAKNVKSLSVDSNSFRLRRIPRECLKKKPSVEIPNWCGTGKKGQQFAFLCELADLEVAPGRIWGEVRPMYGSEAELFQYAYDENCADELNEWTEKLFEVLNESSLIANTNSEYLGGRGGQKRR